MSHYSMSPCETTAKADNNYYHNYIDLRYRYRPMRYTNCKCTVFLSATRVVEIKVEVPGILNATIIHSLCVLPHRSLLHHYQK